VPVVERPWLALAQPNPNYPASLADRLVAPRNGSSEFRGPIGRFGRDIHYIARNVEFPAMIYTAQAILFITRERKRAQAMGAFFIADADAAIRCAKGHQIFAQQPHAPWRSIRLKELLTTQRQPHR